MNSVDPQARRSSFVIKAAVRVGDALGRWQRQRAAARDDAFVEKWKAAWAEGCDACRARLTEENVPYRRGPRRDAWLAGWQWAQQEQVKTAAGPREALLQARSARR